MMKRWQLGDVLGAVLFAFLLGVRLRQAVNGSWFALALVVQAGAAVFLFLTRRAERDGAPLYRKLTAWCAVLLPFGLQADGKTQWVWLAVSAFGVAFSLWGLASLGRSFGIAPSDRGLVTCGAYRLVRHPMYLGELLSYAAAAAGSPVLFNLMLLALIAASFALRIRWEEETIGGYAAYRRQVRWRLLPGVW